MEKTDAIDESHPRLPHHARDTDCLDRPAYRDGRKKTAVKVFAPQHESIHLLVFNVPKLDLFNELGSFVSKFGLKLASHSVSSIAPLEDFSEVHHVTMNSLRDAQLAKRRLDDVPFYGAVLHVTYAPEMETVEETREKMAERERRYEKGLAKLAKERQGRTMTNAEKTLVATKSEEDVVKTVSGCGENFTDRYVGSDSSVESPSKRSASASEKTAGSALEVTRSMTGSQCAAGTGSQRSHVVQVEPPNKKTRLDWYSSDSRKTPDYLSPKTTPKPKIVFVADKFKPKTTSAPDACN